MDIVELASYLVKSVVTKKDSVSVKQFDSEDDKVVIQVIVDQEDMGHVIGKKGKMISAIRTIVLAASYKNGLPKVTIDVDSF